MPYKDPERKKEWERLHRPERMARRRELRHIATTQQATRPDATTTEHNVAGFLIPLGRLGLPSRLQPEARNGGGRRNAGDCRDL